MCRGWSTGLYVYFRMLGLQQVPMSYRCCCTLLSFPSTSSCLLSVKTQLGIIKCMSSSAHLPCSFVFIKEEEGSYFATITSPMREYTSRLDCIWLQDILMCPFCLVSRIRNVSGSPGPKAPKKVHFIRSMRQYDTRGSRLVHCYAVCVSFTNKLSLQCLTGSSGQSIT